jgi:hypothetical protein
MKIVDMPKLFCTCGAEMWPGEMKDDPTEADFSLALAKIYVLGKFNYQLGAAWYVCPNCHKSSAVIPDFPK